MQGVCNCHRHENLAGEIQAVVEGHSVLRSQNILAVPLEAEQVLIGLVHSRLA